MSNSLDPAGRSRPTRLLIVDDDPGDAELVCDILEHETSASYVFRTALTYEAGLEALAESPPDVVLVDFHLGARTGIDFITDAGRTAPGVPAVLLTGAGDPDVDRRAMEAGAVDYLPKADVTADRLERTVRYAVERVRRFRAESRFRALLESGHDLISIIAPDGTISYVSPSISTILGYSAEEKVGVDVTSEVHPEDRERVKKRLEHLSTQGPDSEFRPEPYRVRHADGSWRVLDTIVTNHLDDPAIGGIVIHSRDITEQLRTRERIAFQADVLRAVGQAVIATDLQGRVTYWNPAAEAIYGWSADEAIGRNILDLTPPDTTQEQAAEIMASLGKGETWTGEFEVRRKDGTTFPALVTDSPILDDAGELQGIIGVSSDISAIKETEAALIERVKELRALHGASRVLNQFEQPLEHRLRQVVELIPDGWVHPDLTEARLTLEGRTFETAGFRETQWSLAAPVRIPGGERGQLEVVLTGPPPGASSAPFLTEEAELLANLARLIGDIVRRERLARTLARTFEALDEAVLIVQGRTVVDANPATEAIFGFTRDQIIGRTTEQLHVDRAHYERFGHESTAVLEEEGVFHGQYRMRRSDGSVFHAEQTVSLLNPEEGLSGDAVSVIRDVSERVRAEAELRASEERFRQIAEYVKDVFWISDPARAELSYVSPAFAEVWGRPVEDVLERPALWRESVLPSDRTRLDEPLAREPVSRWEAEYRIVRPDGEVRWIQDRGFPVYEGGVPVRIVGIAEDITARKIAEERFAVLSREVAEGIHVLGTDGRILFATPSGGAILGGDEESVTGRDGFEYVHPEDRSRMRAMLKEIIEDPSRVAQVRYRGVTAEGEVRHLESVARNRIDHPAIGGILVTTRDVTERHRLESQLRQSQKMEAVGRLAGGVAHDFNNLLTVIRSETDLLLMELEEKGSLTPEFVADEIENIATSADRAAELTGQLLAFSREQVLQPRIVDMSGIVAQSVRLLKRVIGEDIELSTDLRTGLPPVRVDPVQLEQVVMNLAVNARDAMPRGGTLRLRTRVEEADAATAGAPGTESGRCVILEVEDTGMGMDQETRDHIFEPFYTTKEKGKGTGLGLATVYGIVKQSGGTIQVESEPGKGALFRLAFPAVAGEPDPQADTDARPLRQLEGVRVLVVEDDEAVRRVTVRVLERAGIEVRAAPTGEAGLDALRENGGFDLLLTDLVLPGMSGLDLVEHLSGNGDVTPMIVMSGYAEGTTGDGRGLPEGVRFLAKPFTPARLLDAVRQSLGVS